MPNSWIRAAVLAGIMILPAQAMAKAGNRTAPASEGVVLASYDGQARDNRYDKRDYRRDHRYDRRDHNRNKPYKARKHKKKSAKTYNRGYKHGLRDSRRDNRKHYRSHNRHHAGYAYGYNSRRATPHYHRGPWGWYLCSAYHR